LDSVVGGFSVGETPGPIPNPEAKPFSADGTALGRVWESRTLPAFNHSGEPGFRLWSETGLPLFCREPAVRAGQRMKSISW
jgi:hypothetical protein